MGFVCRVRASTDNPDPPPKPKCQDIYSDYDQWMNGCYKTNEEAKTWQEAEQSCGSLGGGHLASILTQAEQGINHWFNAIFLSQSYFMFLGFVLNEMRSELTWIGLSDTKVRKYINTIFLYFDSDIFVQSFLATRLLHVEWRMANEIFQLGKWSWSISTWKSMRRFQHDFWKMDTNVVHRKVS